MSLLRSIRVIESMSIDNAIERLIEICTELGSTSETIEIHHALQAIHTRLSAGELHIAVIGQFNRGKSTFINQLTGINLLPVSVLPLTAIPTELRYGKEIELQIQFESEPAQYYSDLKSIESALLRFVTEEQNPENNAGVKSVRLTAPSSLLSHGTTIIDTPGFGSTHIHNTKATVNILKECDAALFVLSADLPITLTELNFIKQITPHISRLFFVYNKTDLLTDSELATTTSFIKKTIESQIGIPMTGRFFPISAKNAAQDREKSGIAAIEHEVLDFLQREKYFSLAEAIQNKLVVTRNHLLQTISTELQTLSNSFNSLRENLETIDNSISIVSDNLAAISSISQSSSIPQESIVSLVRSVSNRFCKTINELPTFSQSAINQLNKSLESELITTCGQQINESTVLIRDRYLNECSISASILPKIPFYDFQNTISLLSYPLIVGTKEYKRKSLQESLNKTITQNSSSLFQSMDTQIRRYCAQSATASALELSNQMEILRTEKTKIELAHEELTIMQSERTAFLRSIQSEIISMNI